MNKNFLLKGLLMSFMLLCTAQTWAYDFEVDNIQYTITSFDNMTVEVSGLTDTNVTEVVIPETVEYRERSLTVTTIVSKAFQSNKTLASASISNTVISIGAYAFDGCSGLREVIIGEGVASIGSYAFQGCSSLLSVVIPDFVTSINTYTFYGCSSLKDVTIPRSVTSIGQYAFYDCKSLLSVIIPNSVTSIAQYAFYGCTSLASVSIGNSVESIGTYAFCGCTSLTEITITNSVTSIGSYAFDSCSGLTKVSINSLVISEHMFNNCSSLAEVTIGNSVTSIGDCAFYDCSSLTEVTIGNSVENIGGATFRNCSSLKELNIPDSVTELGTNALVGCNNIESLSVGVGLGELLEYYKCQASPVYTSDGIKNVVTGAHISTAINYPLLWTDGPSQMKNIILRDGALSLAAKGYYYSASTTHDREGLYPIFSNIDVNYFYVGRTLTYTEGFSFSASFQGHGVAIDVTISVSQPYGVIHTLEIGGYCTNVPYFYQSVEKLILGEDVAKYTAENIYQGNLECIMCKSAIPPTLSGTFSNSTYLNVILYVPIGSKATYQAADGWKNFWNIIEMEVDDMTPVEKIANEKEGPTISAYDGSIIINGANGAKINVYNLSGQVVYSGIDTIIPIANHSVYIVKVGNTTRKVML